MIFFLCLCCPTEYVNVSLEDYMNMDEAAGSKVRHDVSARRLGRGGVVRIGAGWVGVGWVGEWGLVGWVNGGWLVGEWGLVGWVNGGWLVG